MFQTPTKKETRRVEKIPTLKRKAALLDWNQTKTCSHHVLSLRRVKKSLRRMTTHQQAGAFICSLSLRKLYNITGKPH
jgi:hypothetical protein